MSLDKFKAMMEKSNEIYESLAKEIEKGNKKDYNDDRFWKPTWDEETESASAVIRFLPAPAGETIPYVSYYMHNFRATQNAGPVFKQNCPTTIGRDDCPVCNANRELMDTDAEKNKPIVSIRKRKLVYVSNIYVVSDVKNKEAEGKVWLFGYGTTIFEKIQAAFHPKFAGDAKFNPFDLLKGANFRLNAVKKNRMNNYEQSVWDSVSSLSEDEKKLCAVWEKCYPLQQFVEESSFLSYEELQRDLDRVLRWKASSPRRTDSGPSHGSDDDNGADIPVEESFEKAISGAATGSDDVDDLLNSIVG